MVCTGEILVAESKNYVTGDAAFAVDRHGTTVFWNSAAAKTFGCPASTALGQKCWKLLPGHDSYDNSYCHEHCTLKEIAFRHQPVNGFQAALETTSAGRKQFNISCLTILHDPDNELLLHICRPEKETSEDSNKRNQMTTRPSANKPYGELTRREREALVLMAGGKNNREIASVKGISVTTVLNHIQHLLQKLKVHSRLEAVLLAWKQGLI